MSDRDPLDECYDYAITGVPGDTLAEDGLDSTPDGCYGEERWKPTSLKDLWVSDCGRFYNVATGNFIKPTHGDDHGHLAVKVGNKGEAKQGYAHRLLAEAFIENQNNDPYVRHLDDDPRNNDLENLAWGSQYENHLDSIKNGTYVGITEEVRQLSIEKTRHPVVATNLMTGEELHFKSQGSASKELGIPQANIWKVIKNERKSAGGYSFREIQKEEESSYM